MPPEPRTDHPGPHPDPPADLAARDLALRRLSAPWYRVHRADRDPLHFGRAAVGRFGPPAGEFGVLYLGADHHAAFIETFGQSTGINTVTRGSLLARSVARIESDRPLTVLDLTGAGLGRIGADARLTSGDHALARRWSLALWRHPSRPDGLLYRARHDPSRRCLALFDRAAPAVRAVPLGSLADPEHAALLADLLDTYGYVLIPD